VYGARLCCPSRKVVSVIQIASGGSIATGSRSNSTIGGSEYGKTFRKYSGPFAPTPPFVLLA
jgi:hypothetical protein